ncbi:unnamed protein product, partial [Symbiodinium sp. CCMP2592]
ASDWHGAVTDSNSPWLQAYELLVQDAHKKRRARGKRSGNEENKQKCRDKAAKKAKKKAAAGVFESWNEH